MIIRQMEMEELSSSGGRSSLEMTISSVSPDELALRVNAPSVNLAFPPVGWHSTCEQEPHITTVEAWEKTVVIAKQPDGSRGFTISTMVHDRLGDITYLGT